MNIHKVPGEKFLELGGGANKHPLSDVNADLRKVDGVDFACDFNQLPLPIQSNEWDGVIAVYVFEHLSWRQLPDFLKEVYRILKGGGRLYLTLPNTEMQLRWVLTHPEGWDNRNLFESASSILFGDQNYNGNFHSCYWSPQVAIALLREAGFTDIAVEPTGMLLTDINVEAHKSVPFECPHCKDVGPVEQDSSDKEIIEHQVVS
jgi:SAM-dependent methyltransferase